MHIKALLLLLAFIALVTLATTKSGVKVLRGNARIRYKIVWTSNIKKTRRNRIIRCCVKEKCSTMNQGTPRSKYNSTKWKKPVTRYNTTEIIGGVEGGKLDGSDLYFKQASSKPPGKDAVDTAVSKQLSPADEDVEASGEPLMPAVTGAAAVGYTGKTAGEDGDYGEDPAAAPPAGGATPPYSGVSAGTALTNAAAISNAMNSGTSSSSANSGVAFTNTALTNSASNNSASNNSASINSTSINSTSINSASNNSASNNSASTSSASTAPVSKVSEGASPGSSLLPSGVTSSGSNASSTLNNTHTQPTPSGTQSSTTNVAQTATGSSTSPASGATRSTAISSSGAPAAGSSSATSVTIPANTASPDTMSSTEDTPAAEEEAGDPSAPGAKPASKDDDATYDEKPIPPPADYVEPIFPTEPNKATIRPKSNPCIDDNCVMACDKDPAYFPLGIRKVSSTKGIFATVCNKKYFFSNEKKTQAGAFKECCAIGMKLVSIETRAKEDCLIAYNKNTLKHWRLYWTTGSDKACAKKYHWCSGTAVDTAVMDLRIMQPNYMPGQHCLTMVLRYGWTVFFKFYPADNGLNDRECWFQTQYLCEE